MTSPPLWNEHLIKFVPSSFVQKIKFLNNAPAFLMVYGRNGTTFISSHVLFICLFHTLFYLLINLFVHFYYLIVMPFSLLGKVIITKR